MKLRLTYLRLTITLILALLWTKLWIWWKTPRQPLRPVDAWMYSICCVALIIVLCVVLVSFHFYANQLLLEQCLATRPAPIYTGSPPYIYPAP